MLLTRRLASAQPLSKLFIPTHNHIKMSGKTFYDFKPLDSLCYPSPISVLIVHLFILSDFFLSQQRPVTRSISPSFKARLYWLSTPHPSAASRPSTAASKSCTRTFAASTATTLRSSASPATSLAAKSLVAMMISRASASSTTASRFPSLAKLMSTATVPRRSTHGSRTRSRVC